MRQKAIGIFSRVELHFESIGQDLNFELTRHYLYVRHCNTIALETRRRLRGLIHDKAERSRERSSPTNLHSELNVHSELNSQIRALSSYFSHVTCE
jgi:hypothetical protein